MDDWRPTNELKGTTMTEFDIKELVGQIEKALDTARKRDWQKFDRYMEKISELRASMPINEARTIGFAILQDTLEKTSSTKVRIGIEKDNLGLEIHPDGTGTYDGNYAPILLEEHEGTLMLVVWADINQQEPTHLIDLSTALESCRKDTD
jgi:hypothetical protein